MKIKTITIGFTFFVLVFVFLISGVISVAKIEGPEHLIKIHMHKLGQRDDLDNEIGIFLEKDIMPVQDKCDQKLDELYAQLDVMQDSHIILTNELIGLQDAIYASCLLWDSEERDFFEGECDLKDPEW